MVYVTKLLKSFYILPLHPVFVNEV